MSELLHLSGLSPLAKGRMRLVYEHPLDRGLLIKVIRPDVIEERWGAGAAWYKRKRRYGRYISYLREIQEYLAAYARHGRSLPFAQKITGLVETDLGLGLVMEAVRDETGGLAPPLTELLIRDTFDEQEFFVQMLESDLNVADLNTGNLVYVGSPGKKGRFVLIDGLGVATALPLKSFSSWLNRRSKLGRIARLRRSIVKRQAGARARAKA